MRRRSSDQDMGFSSPYDVLGSASEPAGGFAGTGLDNMASDEEDVSPYARAAQGRKRHFWERKPRVAAAPETSEADESVAFDVPMPGELTSDISGRPWRHMDTTSTIPVQATGGMHFQQTDASDAAESKSYGCGNEPFAGASLVTGDDLLLADAMDTAATGVHAPVAPASTSTSVDSDPSEVFSPYQAPSARMSSRWLSRFFSAAPAQEEAQAQQPAGQAISLQQTSAGLTAQEALKASAFASAAPSLTVVPGGAPARDARESAVQAQESPSSSAIQADSAMFQAEEPSPYGAPAPDRSGAYESANWKAPRTHRRKRSKEEQGPLRVIEGTAHFAAVTPAQGAIPQTPAATGPAIPGEMPAAQAEQVAADEQVVADPAAEVAGATYADDLDAAWAKLAQEGDEPAATPPRKAKRARKPKRERTHVKPSQVLASLGGSIVAGVRSPDAPRVFLVFGASILMVCISIAMLYTPAQELYSAVRENERLTNELAANEARNEKMADRVESLQTQEGIQDEARARFGLVLPGENLVHVEGLASDSDDDSTSETPAEVKRGSGENTHTWATDLLDRVFGVEDASTSKAAPAADGAAAADAHTEDVLAAEDANASEDGAADTEVAPAEAEIATGEVDEAGVDPEAAAAEEAPAEVPADGEGA